MQLIPPPATNQHWVYDDPSGVAEPTPYPRRWHPRTPARLPRVAVVRPVGRVRVAHREA
jgi:hypothetical protein